MADEEKQSKAGRKPLEDESERKVPVTFFVKKKNKETVKAKIKPIIKKMDK